MHLLKVGGIMVVPVGVEVQDFLSIERINGNAASEWDPHRKLNPNDFKIESLMGVRYVPLVPPKEEDYKHQQQQPMNPTPQAVTDVQENSSSKSPQSPSNHNDKNQL